MKILSIKLNKNNIIWAICGGILFSLIFVLGFNLESYGTVDYANPGFWGVLLAAALIFALLFCLLFSVHLPAFATKRTDLRQKPFKFFCIVFAALMVIYLICLLGVYPGYFTYDAPWQWFMYSEDNISAHHPVLHTLLLGWFMDLGKTLTGVYIKGVFLFVAFQVTLSCLSFSYALTFLYRRKASRKLLVFAFAWMAFMPTVVINVMAVTKDTTFAILTLPFVLLTAEMVEDQKTFFSKWYRIAGWGLLAFFSAIMRNNAIYPIFLLLAVLIWVNRAYWKKYLTVLLCIVLLYIAYSGPFTGFFTVKGLDREEYFSIPLQQILWVYMNDRDQMTSGETETVESIFTEKSFRNYNPKISDIPKYDFDIEGYYENPQYYRNFWIQLGMRFPADYLNAFLENNFGLWYPWATLIVDSQGTPTYAVCHSYDPIYNDSLIPPIYDYYLLFESSDFLCRNDWSRWCFAPGTYFCFFLVVFLTSLCKRRKAAYALGYLFVFWLTFLLGPVALVRYVSFLFFLFPVLLWFFIDMLRQPLPASSEDDS